MNEQSSDNRAGLRKTVYAILVAVGIGAVIGRILAVDAVEETRLQEYRARLIPRQLAEKRARLVEQGAAEAAIVRELQRTGGIAPPRRGHSASLSQPPMIAAAGARPRPGRTGDASRRGDRNGQGRKAAVCMGLVRDRQGARPAGLGDHRHGPARAAVARSRRPGVSLFQQAAPVADLDGRCPTGGFTRQPGRPSVRIPTRSAGPC